jgi:hypothetical protein
VTAEPRPTTTAPPTYEIAGIKVTDPTGYRDYLAAMVLHLVARGLKPTLRRRSLDTTPVGCEKVRWMLTVE